MPIEIPDLWDDDINIDVLPPLVILKAQDEGIRRKTQGILHTDISTTSETDDSDTTWITHTLDLVATAIGYQESILRVTCREDRLYPATIGTPEQITWSDGKTASDMVRCFDPDEFITELRTALRSPPTKAAIATLLARSNEARLKNR